MALPFEIDFSPYTRNVRVSGAAAMPLALRIVNAKPDDLTAEQQEMIRDVVATAKVVHEVQSARDRSPEQIITLRIAFQNDWSALYEALSAASRVRNAARRKRAAQLLATLFPTGVAFLKLDTDSAWSEGLRRLARIDAEDLRGEIVDLTNAGYLDGVRRGTRELGDAIGVGVQARAATSRTALWDAIAAFSAAVSRYTRSLVGQVDLRDEASVERFRRAVAPIDEHRASRSASPNDPEEPVAPPDPDAPPAPSPTPNPPPDPAVDPTPDPLPVD